MSRVTKEQILSSPAAILKLQLKNVANLRPCHSCREPYKWDSGSFSPLTSLGSMKKAGSCSQALTSEQGFNPQGNITAPDLVDALLYT
jgi:hypothetical protein